MVSSQECCIKVLTTYHPQFLRPWARQLRPSFDRTAAFVVHEPCVPHDRNNTLSFLLVGNTFFHFQYTAWEENVFIALTHGTGGNCVRFLDASELSA